jgi:hypothetical protein
MVGRSPSMLDHPDLRAPAIVFGHWKADLASWFGQAAAHRDLPVDPAALTALESALFEAQREVLFRAVELDLRLFAPGRVLYRDLAGMPEAAGRLFACLADSDQVQAFRADDAPAVRTHGQAYDYYCSTLLSPPRIQGEWWRSLLRYVRSQPVIGLEAFSRRQELAWAFLTRIADQFRRNVLECLQRVRGDRAALEACFLDGGAIRQISALDVPGSDPHKGGRRVVILTFDVRDAQGASSRRRVVYKPSDVEIDYRLAGRNTPALRAFLEARERTGSRAEYPGPPYQSLYELLDETVLGPIDRAAADVAAAGKAQGGDAAAEAERARVRAMLAMPTYVILPRYPGSRLTPADAPPIRQSYGYLEYLPHEPALPSGASGSLAGHAAALAAAAGGADPAWDWITARGDEARACFRSWGRLMSVACLFLQTDLHGENQRICRRKPFVIDLENCLVKPADVPPETLIPGSYTKQTHAVPGWWTLEQKADGAAGDVPLALAPRAVSTRFNVNQLCYAADGRAWTASLDARRDRPRELDALSFEVLKGLTETLEALRRQRQQLDAWIGASGLERCIVRLVPRPTEDYSAVVQNYVRTVLEEQLVEGAARRSPAALLEAFVGALFRRVREEWEGKGARPDNRFHELETVDRNGRDYDCLDVPAWYRRVNSTTLLSSEGRPVAGYFQKSGLELLQQSLETKLTQQPQEARALLDRFTAFLSQHLSALASAGGGR